jgi:hypothetical protein
MTQKFQLKFFVELWTQLSTIYQKNWKFDEQFIWTWAGY